MHEFDLSQADALCIQSIGKLARPIDFDVGHRQNVALLLVTEGEDQPAMYPVMFRKTDRTPLSKSNLLDVLDPFCAEVASGHLRSPANSALAFCLSAKRPATLVSWMDWFDQRLLRRRTLRPVAASLE
ncbi:MAG TPA: hypothetical protein VEK74_01835 [Burkholderiaceae bacterium]|nr:hypothetical protein [Burkholderiaceae bacterium]